MLLSKGRRARLNFGEVPSSYNWSFLSYSGHMHMAVFGGVLLKLKILVHISLLHEMIGLLIELSHGDFILFHKFD